MYLLCATMQFAGNKSCIRSLTQMRAVCAKRQQLRNDYIISWETGYFPCCTVNVVKAFSTAMHSDSVKTPHIYSMTLCRS